MDAAELAYVESLKIHIEKLESENRKLKEQLRHLQEQLEWFQRQLFGKRSEKIVPPSGEQLCLPGCEPSSEQPVTEQNVKAHQRKTYEKGGDTVNLPPDIPVEETIIDIPEAEKVCRETGQPLVKIGEQVTQRLVHEPGSFVVKKLIRLKYGKPSGEGVVMAELPDSLLPRCLADESLLAHLCVQKYADHLPINRISDMLAREKLRISKQLLCQWIVGAGLALKPLYDEMKKQILSSQNVFIDETPVDLQAPGKVQQRYMWVMVGGTGPDPPYRIYAFRDSREHKHASELLLGYRGVLHSDKYGAYVKLATSKQIEWCPCWAHIRRKFFEAQGDPDFCKKVIRKIRYLFMLERVAWARSSQERLRIRQEKEIPIIDELIALVKQKLESGLLPKSKLKEAVGYFCGLIPYLKTYAYHPNARLDNNVAERAVRPLAVGRKNWLFIGSPRAGEAAAIILTLVQTCRGLKINPREYLEDVMRRLMSHNSQRLVELLPDRWAEAREAERPTAAAA